MKAKKIFFSILFLSTTFWGGKTFSQNIAVNTTGTAAAAANMFEVTQPAGAASNSVGIFATNLSTAANAYAIWAAATGAATNKYAIVVPSGGGSVGIGTTTPLLPLHVISNANTSPLYLKAQAAYDAFSILPWNGVTYLSAGIYYNNGAWVHDAATTSNALIAMNPSAGVLWYNSNNSAGSWNVASGATQWDVSGYWKNLVQSTAAGNSYFTGGSVGIGTAVPLSQLHTTGTVRFANYLSGMLGTDASGIVQTRSIAISGTGVAVTNGNGVAGNPTLNLSYGNVLTAPGGTTPLPDGNFGQFEAHGTYTDFNTTPNYWGWNYVLGTTNAPNATSAQWYRQIVSLGSNYPGRGAGGYSLELAYPRYSASTAGVWMRTVENGAYGAWVRLDGGGSGWLTTGNAATVDGTNFIGTTDDIPFNIRVNNVAAGRIENATLLTYNTSFGYQALSQATKGKYNTALGYQALLNNNSGSLADGNTAVGYMALKENISGVMRAGQENTAVGYLAMRDNKTAGGFGDDARWNVAIGSQALMTNTSGLYNTAVGKDALQTVGAGIQRCTALGFQALGNENGGNTVTGSDNIAVGYTTLGRLTSGQLNVFMGNSSGILLSTGSNNTVIGHQSGQTLTTGGNNTLLGMNANVSAAAASNCTAIGYKAYATADNSMVLGSINGTNGATANTNVGIGITAPTAELHVQRNQNAKTRIKITNTTAGTSADAELYIQRADANIVSLGIGDPTFGGANPIGFTGAFMWTGAPEGMAFRSDNAAGPIRFVVNGSGTPTEAVRISPAGYLGIGTTPSTPLQVYTTTANLGIQALTNAAQGNIHLLAGNVGGGSYNGLVAAGDNVIVFGLGGVTALDITPWQGATTGIKISCPTNTTALVGINRTPTTYALEVGGTIWANGTNITAGIATWSDVRYKKNIKTLENTLDKVMKLRGVTYDWRNSEFPDKNFTPGLQIGVIAQEVEKIYPELVMTDKDGYKTVSYEKLTPILIEGMKEQQMMIESLKTENEKLKTSSDARFLKLEAEMKLLLQTTKEEAKK